MSHNFFTHALVRQPAPNMGDGLTTKTLGAPDFDLAQEQYAAYLEALRACGLRVRILPADPVHPDAHFVEDPAVIYRDLTVITRPGAPEREGEAAVMAEVLSHRPLHFITGDGRLDGGDVLFCADRVLIGLTERTNAEGAEQLRNLLTDYDASIRVDFVPIAGVLHLKTGVTELAPGMLLISPRMKTDYPFDFAETVLLTMEEAHAANVLPVNNAILVLGGYPSVSELAGRHYTQVFEVPMSEFEKMDGSLTCLSLRYTE